MMNNKKILALTLGLGLAVGSLTGSYTIAQANEKPVGIQNMQKGHERPMYDKANHQEMLTLLKIDEQTFKQEADSGKSLAEIAAAHNVPRQAVVDLIVKNMNQRIDKGLADKRITMEQANEKKTNVVEKAQKRVDKKHDRQNSQEMLTLLKIDEQTFKQEKDSGKSLGEIAAAHNVSKQAVVDLIVKNMNQHIDKGLADKSITVEQANEKKSNVIDKAQKMVDMKPMDFDKMHNRQNSHDVNDRQNAQGVNDRQNTQDVNDKQNDQGVNVGQNSQDVNNNQNVQDKQQNLQELLTLLKIDEQTFAQEQSSGKSLAAIAATHNISRQAVVDLVTKNMNQQIDKGLADKRITVEQVKEMKTNVVQKVQEMVDRSTVEQPTQPQK